MPRAKRAQVTTKTAGKPAASTSAEKKNGNARAAGDLEHAIRVRAYELYVERGRLDGFAQDDWLQAEAELRSQISRTA